MESKQSALTALRRIEEICTRFEHEWQAGSRPEIAGYLQCVEADQREPLLFELLCIELDHCRRSGGSPAAEEYCNAFTGYEATIRSAFEETARVPLGQTTAAFSAGAGTDSACLQLQPGDGFAGCTIVRQLGKGGMGVVHLAHQKSSDRLVAIKIMRPELLSPIGGAGHGQAVQRFGREARAMGQLVHDNVVSLFEAGEHDGRPYYIMQYVEGSSLRQLIDAGPIKAKLAARYIMQSAAAMQAAHTQGLTHRDLTPGNILISQENDRAMVSDFGLAKLSSDPSNTATGAVFGSPQYMAPEQIADASRARAAADIYSLGATMYHALTGRPPFYAAETMTTLLQVMRDQPAALRSLNPDIPHDLENICLKCLQKEPHSRYLTAGDLAADLQRFLSGSPVKARPTSLPIRIVRWARQNPLPAATGTAAVLILVVGALVSSLLAIEARKQAAIAAAGTSRAAKALAEAAKQRNLAVARQQQAVEAEAVAIHQQKLATHQLQLAMKSAANQLRLYIRPCDIAGRIATAETAVEANAVLAEIEGDESSVSNRKLAKAIELLREAVAADPQQFATYRLADRQKMLAAQAARRLSIAARDTWLNECNANFGSSRTLRPGFMPTIRQPGAPPTTVVELEHEILTAPLYRKLAAAIQQIQTPLPVTATATQHAEYAAANRTFWQLYWGRLAFMTSKEVGVLVEDFSKQLSNRQTDSGLKKRQAAARRLIDFCQKYSK